MPPYYPFAALISTCSHRERLSRATWATFILISFNFTLTTLYWAALLAGLVTEIRSVFVQNLDLGLDGRFFLRYQALLRINIVEWWSGVFQVLKSNSFIAYYLKPICSCLLASG